MQKRNGPLFLKKCFYNRKDKTLYIINEIKPLPIIGKSAVAIGKFDGIHIGHQALLEKIQEQKKQKMTVVVFTF